MGVVDEVSPLPNVPPMLALEVTAQCHCTTHGLRALYSLYVSVHKQAINVSKNIHLTSLPHLSTIPPHSVVVDKAYNGREDKDDKNKDFGEPCVRE